MSAPHVDKTTVTIEETGTPYGMRRLIFLSNPNAPEGFQHVCAGRVDQGHYQPVPYAAFAMSPVVLRKIADLLEGP